jgi:hypothetical protein
MNRSFSAKKQEDIFRSVRWILGELGAVEDREHLYDCVIDTQAGKLRFRFCVGFNLASVFGRFDEPERAFAMVKDSNRGWRNSGDLFLRNVSIVLK